MEALYLEASLRSSKAVTNCYSTSFSMGINALAKEIHEPIYAIYGFVRLECFAKGMKPSINN